MSNHRPKGLHELARELVEQIDESESQIAHVTPGELVIPTELLTSNLLAIIQAEARRYRIDPARLFVGSGRNSINPRTGQPEFFDPSQEPRQGHDVSNEPRVPKGQSDGGQWTKGGSSPGARHSGRLANSHTPSPLLDDRGDPVLDKNGKPMQRPIDVDLQFFVDQGLAARASQIEAYAELYNFRQGGDWDIQRVGPDTTPTKPFIDSSNVAIGLYAAAAGLPQDTVLGIANDVAAGESNFGVASKDEAYTHLRKENVYDIRLGYTLFQSGRIGPLGAK